jgi:hypothetical protein
MEGRLVSDTIDRLAEQAKVDHFHRHRLKELLGTLEANFDGLGFCMSEDGDVLSQWRGYAEDGTGVAIGFSKGCLERMASAHPFDGFVLQKVEYEAQEHEERLRPLFQELQRAIAAGALRPAELRERLARAIKAAAPVPVPDTSDPEGAFTELIKKCLSLTAHQYFLKASAFREEREWRLLSFLVGTGRSACEYRARGGRLVPYRSVDLSPAGPGISSVVLGPKHETPAEAVRAMLARSGFPETEVRRSSATYR